MHKCRCCESTVLHRIIDLGRQAWGNDFVPITSNHDVPTYPLELYFCDRCKMVQLGYTVPKETMFCDHAYLSGTTRSLKTHFVNVGKAIDERSSIPEGGYILDIGGNDGTFLEYFAEEGVTVLNVDSGRLQAEVSNRKNIPCLNAFFNQQTAKKILQEHGPAKVIHGSGIFFHLEELHSVFSGIKELLAPDGLLVAEFVYLPEMVRNCAYDQIYHEHLLYYTLNTFNRLLERHELAINDVQFAPIHGGSCVVFAAHAGTVNATDRVTTALKREIDEEFDQVEIYLSFAKDVETSRDALTALVRDLRSRGLIVQGLGAPVKGSTLINYCGFTHADLQCAVEINPHKCETYYPGTKIPVYHESDMEKPDAYLLLAWNFKDEILEKLAPFRQQGGKIIVPIPNPEVI